MSGAIREKHADPFRLLILNAESFIDHIFDQTLSKYYINHTTPHAYGHFSFSCPSELTQVRDRLFGLKCNESLDGFSLPDWKGYDFTGTLRVWCDPISTSESRSIVFHYSAKFGVVRVVGRETGRTRLTKRAIVDFSNWLGDAAATPIKFPSSFED